MTAQTVGWLQRALLLRDEEQPTALLAGAAFFALLATNYLYRPVRDVMGARFGSVDLELLFTGTFIATLLLTAAFAALVARLSRRLLFPTVITGSALSLVLFWWLLDRPQPPSWSVPALFIWLSALNVFTVSVFWTLMADLCTAERARRLFPLIAAGGTAGGLLGPTMAAELVRPLGDPVRLLPVAALMLLVFGVLLMRLERGIQTHTGDPGEPIAGRIWSALKLVLRSRFLMLICSVVFLYVMVGTYLYFQQVRMIEASTIDPIRQAEMFARRDQATNALTLVLQLFVAARLVAWLGAAGTLALVPLVLAAGFCALAASPSLGLLLALQAAHRAADFALLKPVRDMLFTVVDRETRYKAKNFIDTAVYRGGDVLSAWVVAAVLAMAIGMAEVALLAAILCGLWSWAGRATGREFDQRAPSASGARA